MNMKRRGPFLSAMLKWPIPVFFLALVAFVLIAFALYGAIGSDHWPACWQVDGDRSSLTNTLLSPATSLAGALAAIVLAVHAVQLQEREQRRVSLQAQVEMLKLISEQTSLFMRAYARCYGHIRDFIAQLEIDHGVLTTHLGPQPSQQQLMGLGTAASPVVLRLCDILDHLSNEMDELHVVASSDPFSAAMFRASLGEKQWNIGVDAQSPTVPMTAFLTIAHMLRRLARNVAELVNGANGAHHLGLILNDSQELAAGCNDKDGKAFRQDIVRLMLIQGFLFDDSRTPALIISGAELRPPLAELFIALMSSVDRATTEGALRALFTGNEELEPIIAKLGNFIPETFDGTLKSGVEDFKRLRPRLKYDMVNNQYA